MCFRPAGATKPMKCLKCGTWNKPTNPACTKCGWAGEELTPEEIAEYAKNNGKKADK